YRHLDGYVAQQFDKLDAHKYVSSEYVLYSDSDCIYVNDLDVSSMFGPLPILGMTPYTELENSDGYIWKSITEKLLGFPVTHEFMRALPLLHRTDTLAAFADDYPGIHTRVTGRNVSEFN